MTTAIEEVSDITSSEASRVSAETARASAETSRASAETSRASAETSRVTAETARVSAETARVSAENARNVYEDYNASTAYVVGNKVAYSGSSYKCKVNCQGVAPTDTAKWLLISSKGDAGATGIGVPEGGEVGQIIVKTADGTEWSDKISQITISSRQLFDRNANTQNEYISQYGVVTTNNAYQHTASIDVSGHIGETIYFSNRANETSCFTVCAYRADGTVIQVAGSAAATTYTVPEDVASIIISYESSKTVFQAEYGCISPLADYVATHEETTNLSISRQNGITVYSNSVGTLYTGNTLIIPAANTVFEMKIGFRAKITGFGTLYLGRNKTSSFATYVAINGTTIKAFSYSGGTAYELASFNHGLTISNYISVIINGGAKGTATLTLSTVGGTYTTAAFTFAGAHGDIVAESYNSTFKDVKLSCYSPKWNAPSWLFWDSYSDYVCKYMVDYGANNFLNDAYAGRTSESALLSLNKMLAIHTPKKIIWGMGMNNADSTSAINASWAECATQLEELCTSYGIELIYLTVPNTPIIKNALKNDFIKNSGYRYIDVADAVGASEVGSSWYTGLLSADNVHPSTIGAKLIANTIVAGIPEIM